MCPKQLNFVITYFHESVETKKWWTFPSNLDKFAKKNCTESKICTTNMTVYLVESPCWKIYFLLQTFWQVGSLMEENTLILVNQRSFWHLWIFLFCILCLQWCHQKFKLTNFLQNFYTMLRGILKVVWVKLEKKMTKIPSYQWPLCN